MSRHSEAVRANDLDSRLVSKPRVVSRYGTCVNCKFGRRQLGRLLLRVSGCTKSRIGSSVSLRWQAQAAGTSGLVGVISIQLR